LGRERDLEQRLIKAARQARPSRNPALQDRILTALPGAHETHGTGRGVWHPRPALAIRLGWVMVPALGAAGVIFLLLSLRQADTTAPAPAVSVYSPGALTRGTWDLSLAQFHTSVPAREWVNLAGGSLQVEAELTALEGRRMLDGMMDSVLPDTAQPRFLRLDAGY
jgi:hypothetical protein